MNHLEPAHGSDDASVTGERATKPLGAATTLVVATAATFGIGCLVVLGGVLALRAELHGPEYSWAEERCEDGAALVARLEAHHTATGTYPRNFAELAAFDRGVDHSSTHVTSGESWRYARLADDDFELACALGRWVNVVDWVVYRPDHTYPSTWTDASPYERRFGGWLYFSEGANDSFLPSNQSGSWDD